MTPILAQAAAPSSDSMLVYLVIGVVVVGLSSILQLVLAGKQLIGGNKGERQIEPTQIAAIQSELRTQTLTLNKLDREMGGMSSQVKAVDEKIDAQTVQVDNAFKRINAISIESAAVRARVDGLERREGGPRRA